DVEGVVDGFGGGPGSVEEDGVAVLNIGRSELNADGMVFCAGDGRYRIEKWRGIVGIGRDRDMKGLRVLMPVLVADGERHIACAAGTDRGFQFQRGVLRVGDDLGAAYGDGIGRSAVAGGAGVLDGLA